MPIILCLRQEVSSANMRYPIFVGFAPAAQILELACAPSFSPTTPHSDICTNILMPPVRDWQRPLNMDRVHAIAHVYNNGGDLMPNPVLLCENVLQNGASIVIRQQTSNGMPTAIWEVDIAPSQIKPLWILDGQHRINGLAGSAQRNNPIPVVLLLNQAQQIYQGPLVAKLFAQVTTAAEPLDELHNEWLTFAFRLKDYDVNVIGNDENRKAMHAVAELCRRPLILNGTQPNPFHNKIKFNAHDPNSYGPLPGGFKYSCKDLKDLIHKHYYRSSAAYGQHLSPIDLADQMAIAFQALTASVQAPQDRSVFFGDGRFEQRIMQDAFWVGVFAALLKSGPKTDWKPLLTALKFPITNWNFDWINSLNGTIGTTSRKLALDVFSRALADEALPTASGNLADYLKGNDASVELQFSRLSDKDKPIKTGRSQLEVKGGNNLSQSIAPAKHFRVTKKSGNIGKLEIVNAQHAPGSPVYYRERGENLVLTRHGCPMKLVLKMHHYGGIESSAKVEINW